MDLDEGEALWSIIWKPKSATRDMVSKILFDPRSFSCRTATFRYYLGVIRTIEPDNECDGNATSSTPIDTTNFPNRASALVSHMKSTASSFTTLQNPPHYPEGDFIPLPQSDDGASYQIDTTAGEVAVIDVDLNNLICPDHIDEMLHQVRQLRGEREKLFEGFQYRAPGGVSSSSALTTPATSRSTRSSYDDVYN
eukprot:CAMPEP_0170090478 /NCGR_PEP_ID=MMETSP0019_2-20121128/24330_1 /TAXON_ID=98059 /ORGANISM="Dinobryon sp., Strain UTEXLB2267" /LENGTH=194 /DNA_ID=CAMNT_0010309917 /DNA_START=713 /DNA_END=1297 /DNA_ORIENTATION=+